MARKLCAILIGFFSAYFLSFVTSSLTERPNFVFILTDDQDLTLGGMSPMVKTRKLIQQQGAEFKNMFVTTPLCCPSRASILSGLYAHNHGVVNNSVSGNCSSKFWQGTAEKKTFINYLNKSGYSTLYAGKYLNEYGFPASGGVPHIPPGWDRWVALVGNSCYYNYTLSVNGKKKWHGNDPHKDYLTDVVFQEALKFLDQQDDSNPFFIMISPPAPHSPFTPTPEYADKFSNTSAPRTPHFNIPGGKTKHWLLRQPPNPMPKDVISSVDKVFRNRWRTLLSVDDGVGMIYDMLSKKNMLENTYIFFSSDNGFHLGQFSLPWDKRQLYEFDIRVPLLIRGPGIKPGVKIEQPVLNIDLAPTFLSLAGIQPPKEIDGTSFSSLLQSSKVKFFGGRSFIIEHQGESTSNLVHGCPQYKANEVHTCEIDCICEDSWNNTYICIRTLAPTDNSMHCIFKDQESFVEVYNITADPFQLKNLYYTSNPINLRAKISNLRKLKNCSGFSCQNV